MEAYKRIRKFIDDHHLIQSSIAEAMGMKASTFNQIVNGHRKMDIDEFEKFCQVLNTTPEIVLDYHNQSGNIIAN